MPDYDFRNLSPIDFETLTRDLLQKNLNVQFESFGPGRDQGIDFRFSSATTGKWILQSKHYAGSGFKSLLSRLKREEVQKVRNLRPNRYFLATSVSLTPNQKDEIGALFDFIPLELSDILGKEDLNRMLGEHPEVERLHFKLWFSSTSIFESILNSRVQNFTRDSLERIRESAKVYVQNDSLGDALNILKERNVCIICGIPGIGKTTLAEMLLLHFLETGYEAVRISSDIEDAFAFEYHNTRRVFYYDDFLGRAVIGDKLNKNEDQRLLEFVRAIEKSSSSILIMTTREYILNQARTQYERLANWVNDSNKCVIELSSYTRRARAMIFFNHVYFSSLPEIYKTALTSHPSFLSLIDHKNYNPRLIEFMTDANRLGGTAPDRYFEFFKSNLDNPSNIWRHAFSQLSENGQDLVLSMFSTPSRVLFDDLERVFSAFHIFRCNRKHLSIGDCDFRDALREVEGNFTNSDEFLGDVSITFHNPSVADFVEIYIIENQRVLLDIVESAISALQLDKIWNYRSRDGRSHALRPILLNTPSVLGNGIESVARFLDSESVCRHRSILSGEFSNPSRLLRLVASIMESDSNPEFEIHYSRLFNEFVDELQDSAVTRDDAVQTAKALAPGKSLSSEQRTLMLSTVTQYVLTETNDWREFESVCDFRDAFPEEILETTLVWVRSQFSDCVKRYTDPEIVIDSDQLRDNAERLRQLGQRLDVDISEYAEDMDNSAEKIEFEKEKRADLAEIFPSEVSSDNARISNRHILSMFTAFNHSDCEEDC